MAMTRTRAAGQRPSRHRFEAAAPVELPRPQSVRLVAQAAAEQAIVPRSALTSPTVAQRLLGAARGCWLPLAISGIVVAASIIDAGIGERQRRAAPEVATLDDEPLRLFSLDVGWRSVGSAPTVQASPTPGNEGEAREPAPTPLDSSGTAATPVVASSPGAVVEADDPSASGRPHATDRGAEAKPTEPPVEARLRDDVHAPKADQHPAGLLAAPVPAPTPTPPPAPPSKDMAPGGPVASAPQPFPLEPMEPSEPAPFRPLPPTAGRDGALDATAAAVAPQPSARSAVTSTEVPSDSARAGEIGKMIDGTRSTAPVALERSDPDPSPAVMPLEVAKPAHGPSPSQPRVYPPQASDIKRKATQQRQQERPNPQKAATNRKGQSQRAARASGQPSPTSAGAETAPRSGGDRLERSAP